MKAHSFTAPTPASEEMPGLAIPILVQSSWLYSVAYDVEHAILYVETRNGSVHQFTHVPQQAYWDLLQAVSTGGHFNRHIRGQFPHTLLSQG